jgi:lysozyme family protein
VSAADFQPSMGFIWQPDNDKARDDSAPGENFTTVYGIIQATWGEAVSHGYVTGSIDDATQADCITIYHAMFWNALNGDNLPAGVDLMCFNDAVLSGVGHAAKLLQRVVGANPDGVIGPDTLKDVEAMDVRGLIASLYAADATFLHQLANAPRNPGWFRREDEARALALKLAGITPGGNLTGFSAS